MRIFKSWLANEFYRQRHRMAKRRYDAAVPESDYLSEREFKNFVKKYGTLDAEPFQDYSLAGLQERGRKKAAFLSSFIRTAKPAVLEIGAADGFALKELLHRGAGRAVAVDIADSLHSEVKAVGTALMLGSAEDMSPLESDTFDLIYSWGSFEHILNIKKAFGECVRLLRPGGTLYIEAGPLYYSPWGYHYYSVLRVPYVHLLFRSSVLEEYSLKKNGKHVFPWTSGNAYAKYAELVENLPPDIVILDFWHGYDWFSSDMIIRYPDVFKSKQVPFDDFFIDCVRLTLKKRRDNG